MPRLYFDLHECGTVTVDEEGRELPDVAAARKQAVTAARAVMCDEIAHGRLCLSCRIDIRDEAGATVASIAFKDTIAISGL